MSDSAITDQCGIHGCPLPCPLCNPMPRVSMGIPYKCPKCDGLGQLLFNPQMPYSSTTSTGPWQCDACLGTGIIYS